MLLFVTVIVILLWLVQTVYLDDFYKKIRIQDVDKAMEDVVSITESDLVEDDVKTIAENYDICVLITDLEGNTIQTAESSVDCVVHKMEQDRIQLYINRAKKNDGELQFKTNEQKKTQSIPNRSNTNPNSPRGNNPFVEGGEKREETNPANTMPKVISTVTIENIVSVRIINLSNGAKQVVFICSQITPVDSTVRTLQVQLIYISVVVIVLSLLLALLISRRVSNSIIMVNESAKELSKGDFDIVFEGKDYKEIAELSDTLNHTVAELAKAEHLQKELIANVSHDLRTPLTMITAYAEVMRDLPGENTPENVQVVIDEAKRLTNLVNDLLDVSKLQAGVTSIEVREYNLTESIKAVIDRYAKLVEQNGYIVEFIYDHDVYVEADEYKIFQVIYNLINNAINYTGEDKRVIVKQIANGNIVRIEVIDTGAGIAKEELDNVWERYYKVDKNHKRAVMGTGLGLSIVKNILKLHDAKYGVKSKLQKGSTFWFELKMKGNMQKEHENHSI